MKKAQPGISATIGLLVIVVIIGAAFFVAIPMVAKSSSTTSTTGTSVTSTGNTGSSTSTGSGSTGSLTLSIAQPLIVAPGTNESVAVKFAAGLTGAATGNFTLSASSLPKGVTATFSPSSINLPSQLSNTVTLTLSAASGAAVANATVNLVATAGSSVFTQPVSLMSVQALVFLQGNTFVPNSLTVAAGTKVYWMNLDSGNGEAGGISGGHDVTAVDGSFSSGAPGSLQQYGIYGHTFASAGTVAYQCKAAAFTGQIVVTG